VFGAVITARVGPSSLANSADLGLARVLDYTQPLPNKLKGVFDVVFDCHGGLTSKEEDFLTKRSGTAVDIDPTIGNLIRSLISSKHSFVRGVPSTLILQKVVNLASAGQFTIPINRTAPYPRRSPWLATLKLGTGFRANR
jgi:NADPH:quinone reductase-like Zn-dependent oxidoreductase